MTLIAGYTTGNNKWERLVDKELIKHDLLMNLFIRKGECDWNPELGTTIDEKIFQIKTDDVRNDIIDEIRGVMSENKFISLQNIETQELENGWIFNLAITYLDKEEEIWSIPITEDTVKGYLSDGTFPLKEE